MKRTFAFLLAVSPFVAHAQSEQAVSARALSVRRGVTPQIRDASTLFDGAEPHEGNVRDGTLLCRVNVARNRRYDGAMPRGPVSRRFGAPDLNVHVRVGGQRLMIHGPEDRYSTTVSVPRVSIRAGQRIGIHADDRDALRNDVIGDAVAVFQGNLPIELPGMQVDGACRLLDPAIVTRRLPAILRRTDAELDRAAQVAVDLNADEIASPESRLNRATYHLYDGAALAGWEHSEVAERVGRGTRIREAHQRALSEAIDSLQLPAVGRPVPSDDASLEVRVTRVDCGHGEMERFRTLRQQTDPASCAVRLEVATSRARRFRPQVRALTRSGRLSRAVLRVRERNDTLQTHGNGRLAAGELHVLWILVDETPDILRLKFRGETLFIRAR